jgi:hypothetical protein
LHAQRTLISASVIETFCKPDCVHVMLQAKLLEKQANKELNQLFSFGDGRYINAAKLFESAAETYLKNKDSKKKYPCEMHNYRI